MNGYRKSYWKTVGLAILGGTLSLLLFALVILGPMVGMTWIAANLPPLVMWSAGILFLLLALLSACVAVGGLLALRYEARGRAYF